MTGGVSKSRYWRAFGAALFVHSAVVAVSIGFAGGSLAEAVGTVAVGLVVLGLWGAIAPRGAAIALATIMLVEALGSGFALVSTHHLVVIPGLVLDVLVGVLALLSIRPASAYLSARREEELRLRDYDRQERLRTSSGS